MNTDLSPSIARASRIIGLGLLAFSLGACGSLSRSEVRFHAYCAMALGLWCLIEIVLTYVKRPT